MESALCPAGKTAETSAKTCDLCGGSNFALVSERDRKGQPLRTVLCEACGLLVHESVPTVEELQQFYAREYRLSYHGELSPSDRRVLRAWESGRSYVKTLRNFMQPGERVFEIGAGIGCTVRAFAEAGFAASGIEPGRGFQEFARKQLQVDVQLGDLEDLELKPRFDVILLVHVIEHLRSPREALERIHALLAPGGRLFVACPNAAQPRPQPHKLFHYAHIYNFTAETLLTLARRCGFELESGGHLGDPRNLSFVLRKSETRDLTLDPAVPGRVLAALHRYNILTYHLRPEYLHDRWRQWTQWAHEFLTARHRVQALRGPERVAA